MVSEDEAARLAVHRQYRQTVGPSWSDSEEEENPGQPSNHRPDHRLNEHGEPLSPPPPYSEQDHGLSGDQTWSHDRVNLYPGEGGRAEYVTDSSGRRERYVVDGFGHRVPWPFVDRENSSYNGEEDPDMIYLESGRVLPRSEWDDERPMEYSSEDPADDREQDNSHSRRAPGLETRRARPRHWSSEDDDSDCEDSRTRGGHGAGPRSSGRQSLAGRGGQFGRGSGERSTHVDPRTGGNSDLDHDQEESSINDTDSERSDEAQARYHRVWGSTGISFEMAASTGARR